MQLVNYIKRLKNCLRHQDDSLADAAENKMEDKQINYKNKTFDFLTPPLLTKEQKNNWDKNGYLVLPGFFDESRIDQINNLIDEIWENRKFDDNPLVIDAYLKPRGKRMYMRDVPDDARLQPYKLNDLFLESSLVQEIVLDLHLSQLLRELLEGSPLVCNSLTFEYGSQQPCHFDTFFMPPPVENKLIASWIALDDVNSENGPLIYYPGSHKIPPYIFEDGTLVRTDKERPLCEKYIYDEIEKRKLKRGEFHAKKGDVLIWHAQLFHGGEAIKNNKLTRKSFVTHYFRKEDFSENDTISLGHGRYYLKRDHQPVPG